MIRALRTVARTLAAVALCAEPVLLAPAVAAPPPPGWEERHRAEACTDAPEARPVQVSVRPVAAAKSGVRGRLPAIRFDRAFELRYDPAFGRALGIALDFKLGLVLATDRGYWLRLPPPDRLGAGTSSAYAYPMIDVGAPVAQSDTIWGSVIVARADGVVVSYDLGSCGFGAKPLPNGEVTGGVVRTLAVINPSHGGFVSDRHILAGGSSGRAYGEAAFSFTTASQVIRLGAPLSPLPAGGRPVALGDWDVDGGCDAVRFVAEARGTRAVSFCSPKFAESTIEVRGDVGVHVTRALPGRANAVLAEFDFPVTAETGRVVLTAPAAGQLRLTILAIREAVYREDPPPPRR